MKSLRSPFDGPFGRGPFGASQASRPVITTPGDQEITLANLPRTFSSGTGRQISVSDMRFTSLTDFTITVTGGTATLAGTTGLTFDVGDGTADATMSFSGTITNINNALNGMTVTGSALPIVVALSASHTKGTSTASLTIDDTIAPTISSLSPTDGASSVALTVSPAATFSENIAFGTGEIVLRASTESVATTRAADGETTNLTASNGTFTSNVSDADGGSDAIRFTSNNTSGVASQISFQTSGNIAFNNGTNRVRLRVKDVGTGSPWIRISFENVTAASTSRLWVKPSDGTQGATGSNVSGVSISADAGSDGYVISFDDDIAGADVSGTLQIRLTSGDGVSSLAGTGNEAVRFHDITVGSVDVERFNVATEVGSGAGQVSISGAVLTINPTVDLVENSGYSIYIPSTAIEDVSGNPFAGILDNTTWNFTTSVTDSAAPGILSTYPADNSTNAPVDAVLTATFNEPIVFGTGNVTLRKNDGGWTDVEAFNVATEVGTTAGKVNIVGDTLYIYPTANLSNDIEYAVRIDATAIDDAAANSFPGIADDTTWSFTAYNLPLYGFNVTPETGGTTASIDLSYNADEIADGTFYFVVQPASVASPTAAQIRSGLNGSGAAATWADSVPYSSIDSYSAPASGLIQDTAYEAFATHRAADGVTDSNTVEDTFTTPDEIPILTSPTDVAASDTTATLGVTTNDPDGTLYWVVSTSSTAPTATQIRAGQMHTGSAAAASGSQAISSAGAKTGISATGLTAATAYYAHFHHRDAANQDSAVVSGDGFTTASAETVYYNYADDGTSTGLSVLTAGTFTTAQSDPDGGSNAILYTCGSAGAGAANGIQVTAFNYTNAGVNKFRFKYKKGSWASGNAYLRVKTANMSTNAAGYININTGVWAGEGATWANVAIADLGSGWYSFYGEIDMTAFGDRNGALQIYFGDATADQTITANADHEVYFYTVKASY